MKSSRERERKGREWEESRENLSRPINVTSLPSFPHVVGQVVNANTKLAPTMSI